MNVTVKIGVFFLGVIKGWELQNKYFCIINLNLSVLFLMIFFLKKNIQILKVKVNYDFYRTKCIYF